MFSWRTQYFEESLFRGGFACCAHPDSTMPLQSRYSWRLAPPRGLGVGPDRVAGRHISSTVECKTAPSTYGQRYVENVAVPTGQDSRSPLETRTRTGVRHEWICIRRSGGSGVDGPETRRRQPVVNATLLFAKNLIYAFAIAERDRRVGRDEQRWDSGRVATSPRHGSFDPSRVAWICPERAGRPERDDDPA